MDETRTEKIARLMGDLRRVNDLLAAKQSELLRAIESNAPEEADLRNQAEGLSALAHATHAKLQEACAPNVSSTVDGKVLPPSRD